jgi:hypothetical protein
MASDERAPDARFVEELTPLPVLGPTPSPLEAELAVARATCEQQRLVLASLQAKNDEKDALIKQLREDRRALAARVKSLEQKLASK